MREMAKSLVGFTWAVSLFGLQQMSKLIAPAAEENNAASEVDEVSKSVQSHLSSAYADQFRAGDEWQRRVVDVMFDAGTLKSLDPQAVATSLDPRKVVQAMDPRAMVDSGVQMLKQSVDAVRETVQPSAKHAAPPVM
jgi:hypothetical protein